jgi:hypothetical protein
MGTVGAWGFSLSMGQILLSLKELSGNQENIITGSLDKYGSNLSMIAILKGSMAWEVKQILPKENSSLVELIPVMTDELAFQIALDTSEGKKPQTWQAYKYGILAKEAYISYNATGDVSDLYKATSNAKLAKSYEPHYSRSIEVLRFLEYAWNNKGNELQLLGKHDEATYAYLESISLNDTIKQSL